jgi:sulfite exporter TauE/SafE
MIGGQMTLLAALVAGLFSSAHCFGMCGGIAAALGGGNPAVQRGPVRGLGYQLLFNSGRIVSYMIAGAIAGGMSFWLGELIDVPAWTGILRIATGLIMVAIGLQLAINWRGLRHIEALGGRFWRRLAPLVGRLLPVRTPGAALGVGMLWGWLPCGLVYTMLLAAAMSGGAVSGSALMLAFGAGTLPAMITIGASAGSITRLLAQTPLRRGAGALLLAFGVWTMAMPILHHGHGAHSAHDVHEQADHPATTHVY